MSTKTDEAIALAKRIIASGFDQGPSSDDMLLAIALLAATYAGTVLAIMPEGGDGSILGELRRQNGTLCEALAACRLIIADLPATALGIGGDGDGATWPIRDEVLKDIDKALAFPLPAIHHTRERDMSATCIITEMADALVSRGTDTGDERYVEAALWLAGYWQEDIDQHMHAAIDRASALRILADGDFETLTIGG